MDAYNNDLELALVQHYKFKTKQMTNDTSSAANNNNNNNSSNNTINNDDFIPPPYSPELKDLVQQLPNYHQYNDHSLAELCKAPRPRKYGLPLAKCLANYLRYEFVLQSQDSMSTDVILKLKDWIWLI